VDFKQNHLTQNFEASLQACGTPNFWSAPAQPASLALNVSSNRFENGGHIGGVELYIRDYTPSAMDHQAALNLDDTTGDHPRGADAEFVPGAGAHGRVHLSGAGLRVSPFCLGRTASADTVVAAYEAGINFFFVTADLHWPLYDGIRRGLAKPLQCNPFTMIF